MSYVEVKNLCKKYKETKIFENLNFSIEEGEFLTLLGPSGCGKSTLLRSIAGLEEISGGEIFVEGKGISGLNPRERNISMVFQSYALFPNMTVSENIAFGLKMKKMSKDEIDKKVKEMISLVELNGKENNYPKELSGGQQQRVALARALAIEPKILLLDEPLSALDAKIRKTLRLQIRKLQKELNITTIFVTHDQEEALTISDRIFVIEKGNISQMGSSEEIYSSPKNEFVARFIGNYNVINDEEIFKIFNSKIAKGIYAVRPESIFMCNSEIVKTENEGITTTAVIQDKIVLGNVMRYHVKCGEHQLVVDLLNSNLSEFIIGKEVYLFIPIEECKLLE